MLLSESYELLDFGNGRKLENFAGILVDRPSPVAEREKVERSPWTADLRFDRTGKSGRWHGKPPEEWVFSCQLAHHEMRLKLKPTPAGQVGVFPEQFANWQWIAKKCRSRANAPRLLNLFAYTGGSTLAAAFCGAEVTHVDASKSVVNWARINAAMSGLDKAPIRWIVEDAVKFVAREIKRGNRYEGIVMDPPSYGHGPKGNEWKLSRDLIELLSQCKSLLSDDPLLFLLSCHTPGFGQPELNAALSSCLFGSCAAGVRTQSLLLRNRNGRALSSGHAALWP